MKTALFLSVFSNTRILLPMWNATEKLQQLNLQVVQRKNRRTAMMIKKILIPYDGSKRSQRAFKYAVDLATKYNSSIHVLTVIKGPYTGKPYMTESQEKSGLKSPKERIQKMHSVLKNTAGKHKLKMTTETKYSESVVQGVLDSAKTKKADFVVIGSRGLTGFKELLLGSVAAGVSHHANCPVLIVR